MRYCLYVFPLGPTIIVDRMNVFRLKDISFIVNGKHCLKAASSHIRPLILGVWDDQLTDFVEMYFLWILTILPSLTIDCKKRW